MSTGTFTPGHGEYHIDHPETAEELDRKLERDFEADLRDDPAERERVHQAVQQVRSSAATVVERMDRLELQQDLNREDESADEDYGDDEKEAFYKEFREFLAAEKKERDANSAPESTWSTVTRFMAIAAGVGAMGAGISALVRYFIVRSKGEDPSKDPVLKDIPADTLKVLKKMYQDWAAKTPAQFFTQLAARVRKDTTLSVGDHVYFMDLVVKLKPLTTYFLWDSLADKVAMVERFSQAWIAAGPDVSSNEKAARLYEAAAAEKYQDAAVPTKVMAGVLRLVFANLGFNPAYKGP